MAIKYVVDTHALIWFLAADPRLGKNAEKALSNPDSELILPIIALAEGCWIVEIGRTNVPNVTDLLSAIDADPRITVMPLNRAIFDKTLTLSAIHEMHDRQIVATALAGQGESVAMLTRDKNIRDSELVPIIW